MSQIELRNLTKSFEGKPVVQDLNLQVHSGELVALLGQSGCGKTTTLRMISGLLKPDKGDILFDNQSIDSIDRRESGAVMVFQNHRLFPHMTVSENIAFGLKVRKKDQASIKKKVSWALEMVKLPGFEKRYPSELSGGQSQRIALARALVLKPKVLLLDEPLSNLDAVLRDEMRGLIRNLHQTLNLTIVFVTHDQKEAMLMADRIAIMRSGVIEQVDTPLQVYYRPINRWIAGFIGLANLINGEINNGYLESSLGRFSLNELTDDQWPNKQKSSSPLKILIRPEEIKIKGFVLDEHEAGWVTGKVVDYSFTGESWHYQIEIGQDTILVSSSGETKFRLDDKVQIKVIAESICIYNEEI